MKQNIRTNLTRLVALFIALVMSLSTSTIAFATDATTSGSESNALVPISESNLSREEALEILGITEEELGNGNLYVMDVPISPTSTNATKVLNPGDVLTLDSFTFTDSNVGSTLLAFNATKAMFGVVWKWLNPESRNHVILKVTLTNGLGNSYITALGISGFGDGESHTLKSEWGDVSSAYSYHFEYVTNFGYWEEEFPAPRILAQVVVAAA